MREGARRALSDLPVLEPVRGVDADLNVIPPGTIAAAKPLGDHDHIASVVQDLVEAHLDVPPVGVDRVRPLRDYFGAAVQAVDAGEGAGGSPFDIAGGKACDRRHIAAAKRLVAAPERLQHLHRLLRQPSGFEGLPLIDERVHPHDPPVAIADHDPIPRVDEPNLFFQIVSSLYERASLNVTSNKPFGRWGEVFGDEVVAAAMIDRLVHHAEVVALRGDSYRLKNRDLGRIPTDPADTN